MEDSRPMQSKKFIAYLIATISWKLVIGSMIFIAYSTGNLALFWFILIFVSFFMVGFIEVGYLLSQAGLDKFLRLAKMATDKGLPVQLGKDTRVEGVMPVYLEEVKDK
jgi:hypothetical protein